MANVKIDKEALQKNRFWILLGVDVPLILAALAWLTTSVSSKLSERQKAIEKTKRETTDLLAYKTTVKQFDSLTTKAKGLEARKDEVWKVAWAEQKDLIQWPPQLLTDEAKRSADLTALYFGDPIPDNLRTQFHDPKAYGGQVQDLIKMVAPTVCKKAAGTAGDGWDKIINPVRWNVTTLGEPKDDDVWLAEEDLMVQRELFLAVQQTNRGVARFVQEKEEAKRPKADAGKGQIHREIFRNPYWELDLALSKPGGKWFLSGTIKNIGKRRQMLARVSFKIWGEKDKMMEEVTVQGESLAPDESAVLNFMDDKDLKKDKPLSWVSDPTGLMDVEQVLDLTTVPVKRIDLVDIGRHGHRTYSPKLSPLGSHRRAAPGQTAPAGTPETAPLAVGGSGSGSGTAQSDKTRHGLERNRYMNTSDQVRRLPVAFVVVVDQAYGEELLTALANLKLRLQTTQVDWHRFRGDLQPPDNRVQPMPPPTVESGGAAARAAALEKTPMSLVEVAYYGIATLYERYPPKGAATKTEGTP